MAPNIRKWRRPVDSRGSVSVPDSVRARGDGDSARRASGSGAAGDTVRTADFQLTGCGVARNY